MERVKSCTAVLPSERQACNQADRAVQQKKTKYGSSWKSSSFVKCHPKIQKGLTYTPNLVAREIKFNWRLVGSFIPTGRLQKYFEQLSEQSWEWDGPVKSNLKMIISEVYTALLLINWLSRLGAGNLCVFCKITSPESSSWIFLWLLCGIWLRTNL